MPTAIFKSKFSGLYTDFWFLVVMASPGQKFWFLMFGCLALQDWSKAMAERLKLPLRIWPKALEGSVSENVKEVKQNSASQRYIWLRFLASITNSQAPPALCSHWLQSLGRAWGFDGCSTVLDDQMIRFLSLFPSPLELCCHFCGCRVWGVFGQCKHWLTSGVTLCHTWQFVISHYYDRQSQLLLWTHRESMACLLCASKQKDVAAFMCKNMWGPGVDLMGMVMSHNYNYWKTWQLWFIIRFRTWHVQQSYTMLLLATSSTSKQQSSLTNTTTLHTDKHNNYIIKSQITFHQIIWWIISHIRSF